MLYLEAEANNALQNLEQRLLQERATWEEERGRHIADITKVRAAMILTATIITAFLG